MSTGGGGGAASTDLVDVCVVGDGPAGLALAAASARRGLDVVVVGPAIPWRPTYGVWADELDDLEGLPERAFARQPQPAIAYGNERHVLGRTYGVLDNTRVRDHLLASLHHRRGEAVSAQHFGWGSRVVVRDGTAVDCRVAVDATGGRTALLRHGAGRAAPAVQAAYGVVLPERPTGVDEGVSTLMDWRPTGGDDTEVDPTFLYAVDVRCPDGSDGFLVEETSLARRPPLPASDLRRRLVTRLGSAVDEAARKPEIVAIDVGDDLPSRAQAVVGFGGAAGFVHPASGYSVAASFRAAPRVADALAEVVAMAAEVRSRLLWDAVLPAGFRRTRALHLYGLAALLRMRPADARTFFDAFFDLPVEQWSAYLRIDASARDAAAVMTAVFSSVPWQVRRRLALASPAAFAQMMR